MAEVIFISLLEKFIGYRDKYKGVYTTINFCFYVSMHVFMFVNVCFLFT